MAETGIEWVKNPDGSQGRTWNPIRGCTRISPGCGGPGPHGGCYAEVIAARFSGPGLPYHGIAEMRGGKARWTGKLAFVEEKLTEPLKVRKPTTWFVNSMSDLFHESVPDAWIDRVFAVMALCPQHTFQVLTKRSARMRSYMQNDERSPAARVLKIGDAAGRIAYAAKIPATEWPWPLPNVWLGVSAEDQRRADERVPDLLATPAAVRFVSAEPLLGPIDFRALKPGPEEISLDALAGAFTATASFAGGLANYQAGLDALPPLPSRRPGLDWIIVGGESGPGARPMHPDWARQIRDACAAAGVAFHFKQWGEYAPGDHGKSSSDDCRFLSIAGSNLGADRAAWGQMLDFTMVQRVGKKAAGRLLDGVEHNGFPEVTHG